MEAGQALDAAIHQQVFGEKVYELDYGTGGPSAQLFINTGRQLLPHYSSDIAAAWQVVEHFRKRDDPCYMVRIATSVNATATYEEYECVIGWVAADEREYEVFARGPAPLAICLAALKAIDATSSHQS